ncbi:MAG: hypothetical protein KF859_05025 [Phycisphaeraceae bacterium]|nr:hypothetical protein [Phycisphaeraceae bacterium]
MSVKWRRIKTWENTHLRGPFLSPLRWILHAFSSITMAVVVLVLVSLYGAAASIPVGLLALVPTMAVYGLTVVLCAGVAGGAAYLAARALTHGRGRGTKFAARFVAVVAGSVAGVFAWWALAWPMLHYDPATGKGLRFFADFVRDYGAVTVRRLPGLEMSELEFYAWWPLRWLLLLFVVNMVVATARRIEFTFRNVGVLSVHTGIVLIALGSVYYSGLKREGDTVLFAGPVNEDTGIPVAGPTQDRFFDNTRVALYVSQGGGLWDSCRLEGLPRYNDYNLGVSLGGRSAWDVSGRRRPWEGARQQGPLSIPCVPSIGRLVDADLQLRIVGYCAFGEPVKDWIETPLPASGQANPLRIVYMHSAIPDSGGHVSDEPVYAFTLAPRMPAERVSDLRGDFSLEFTAGPGAGMSPQRWQDLGERLPEGTLYAVVVEVPGTPGRAAFRGVYPAGVGRAIAVGDTGYTVTLKELHPEPPFPIITEGYRGATSSVAVVGVSRPSEAGGPFERWVYSRFPEINQDIREGSMADDGRPARTEASGDIRIALIDASQLHVYLDEAAPGVTRAIVRQRGGGVRVVEDLGPGGRLSDIVPKIALRVGERWPHAVRAERASPASEETIRREKQFVGTHDKALVAVEVRSAAETRVVWVPFTKYFGMGENQARTVTLSDGRRVEIAFGRLQHPLPGFVIQLADFQMISYDHRGAPRDYQSLLRVTPTDADFIAFEHITKLNAPLRAPFLWDDRRPWPTNVIGTLQAGLSPFQFKFSQAGWDSQGWEQSQKQADAGLLQRPFARFTILGVGNNPGIHIVALGGVLMAIGIPWAFYLKPYLVQREKRRIQQELAAGKRPRGVPPRMNAPEAPRPAEVAKVGAATP